MIKCVLRLKFGSFFYSSGKQVEKKMTDVALSSVWGQYGSYTKDTDIKEAVMYMNNMSFSKFLDPCKNVKFPGQMVVSVSRKHIPLFLGSSMVHIPYKMQEIQAWFDGRERSMPSVQFSHQNTKHVGRSSYMPSMLPAKKNVPLTEDLDFGPDEGLFQLNAPVLMNTDDIDFGEQNGLFLIPQKPQ